MSGEESLLKEVFFLAYHLHWSRESILGMPVPERRRYVEMLQEELTKQAEAMAATRR